MRNGGDTAIFYLVVKTVHIRVDGSDFVHVNLIFRLAFRAEMVSKSVCVGV